MNQIFPGVTLVPIYIQWENHLHFYFWKGKGLYENEPTM